MAQIGEFQIDDPIIAELDATFDAQRDQGSDRMVKVMLGLVEAHDLQALFPTEDRRDFRDRVQSLFSWRSQAWRQAYRLAQLLDGNFRFWVYKHDMACPHHAHFDGLALVAEHSFWRCYYPSNGWQCSCSAFGTRFESGIRRVGGDPDKTLASDWFRLDPITSLPKGIDAGFLSQVFPDMNACLVALASGIRYRPQWPQNRA